MVLVHLIGYIPETDAWCKAKGGDSNPSNGLGWLRRAIDDG